LLSTIVGSVDVIGFLRLGGLLTARITRNLVIPAAQSPALPVGLALLAVILGVVTPPSKPG
jgi:uncharacterized membrane protein YoaK (UPF0700 family)